MLTQQQLKEVLYYDPITGLFTWLINASTRARIDDIAGAIDNSGRRKIQIGGMQYYASRLAHLYMTGQWPVEEIDHKDRNKLNDAWDNLREATRGQNTHNRCLPVGESGLRGVRRVYSNPHRWEARISLGGQRVTLGTFDSVKEAHAAYLTASESLHGDFAPHNRQGP